MHAVAMILTGSSRLQPLYPGSCYLPSHRAPMFPHPTPTARPPHHPQLRYVNTKLEQERRSARDKADAGAAQSRSGLEALRGRLAEVERSVHRRSVEAQRAVQRLHSLVQGLQAAAMPMAVAAAAAAPAAAPPALKSPLPGGGRRSAAQQQHATAPEALHRHFAQVFGGLAQLAELFAGGSGGEGAAEGTAAANPAPLLLTAPDGSRKAVHWQDQNGGHSNAASQASSASLGSAADGGCSSGAGVAAAASAASRESRLAAEVQRLRAALAESRQRAAASEAKAAAAAASSAAAPASSGRVEAAMRQLDAVVPQYRAAAQALQGQVAALRDKLAAAGRERAALQEEVRTGLGGT